MRDLLNKLQYGHLTHRDVVEARSAGDDDALTEASLGRVYQHVANASYKSMAIISAFRADRDERENLEMNERMGADLVSAGHGFFKLNGVWRECQDKGVAYRNCPPGRMIEVREVAMGVVGAKKALILRLVRKYDQDAAVYLGPDTNGDAILIYRDGSEKKIGSFKPSRVAQAYSRVKGKTFVFEWVTQSYTDALIEQSMSR